MMRVPGQRRLYFIQVGRLCLCNNVKEIFKISFVLLRFVHFLHSVDVLLLDGLQISGLTTADDPEKCDARYTISNH